MSYEAAMAAIHAEIARDNDCLRRRFLATFTTFTATEIAEPAGPQAIGMRELDRWRAEGLVFAISANGEDRYPAFQFANGRPRPVVAQVLATLPPGLTPWQVAFWFVSSNSWLGGAAPVSIVDTDPESVVCAAERERDEVAG